MAPRDQIRSVLAALNRQLAELRAANGVLKAAREDVLKAPLSESEAHGQVDQLVDHMAAPFRERFHDGYLIHATPVDRLGEAIGLDVALSGIESAGFARLARKAAPLDLMCWLLADQLRARLHGEVAAVFAKLAAGLPAAERRERIAGLDADILRLEYQEEQVITEAEEAGFDIPRRADADPRAVLGVTFAAEPAAA